MKYFIFLLLPFLLQAQTKQDSSLADTLMTEIVKINLKDGSVFIGKIISEDNDKIIFETNSGIKSEIPKVEIMKRSIVTNKLVKGEVWESDPNQTRLFFSPTGRALDKGEGYFSVYEIFFPFLAVGVTDNFTLAGGMSLFPGADSQILYVAPKYTFVKNDNLNIAAGVLYLKVPEISDGGGILYGVGTFGESNKALTFGFGYGFSGGDFTDNPLLTIGGELRTGKNTKLITENWIFLGEADPLFSAGIRFFGEKIAGDFGFMVPPEADFLFPWVGFAYNF